MIIFMFQKLQKPKHECILDKFYYSLTLFKLFRYPYIFHFSDFYIE
jgi:hypothetical protein